MQVTHQIKAQGKVVKAFANLLQVKYEGDIRQGEVVMVKAPDAHLKAEVIEIMADEAKIQVYEDTRSIRLGTEVEFTGDLLEAELGPGLLTSIFDGLQNPLKDVAAKAGMFLTRGVYNNPIDRTRTWNYQPLAKVGEVLKRGDTLGLTQEGRFEHNIMLPFSMMGQYRVSWTIDSGDYTVDTVVAKVVDEQGKEISLDMLQKWPVKVPLHLGEKIKATELMEAGLRVIDTQVPILKGGTFCSPGPFGAGKTVLQHHLSKYSDVDIVVVCACGERAGEVVEILREFPKLDDPHSQGTLIERTVIICNTSSMPVAARESSVYMGVTIAEYYRQMGLDVLLLADSTSRWAQALREMSGRLEEIPGEEAFPAYLSSRVSEFYERSGVYALKGGKQGSVTIGGAVSPAGGNFEEPVTQCTLSVVGAFLGLSRARSDARRYPAIDPLISWSKYVEDAGKQLDGLSKGWGEMVQKATTFLQQGDEIGKRMEVVGEEGTAIEDLVSYLKSELYDFCYLQQNAFDKEDAYCPLKKQIPLFNLINRIFDMDFHFKSHDEAHQFFLKLQDKVKNLNYLALDSSDFQELLNQIDKQLKDHQVHVLDSRL